MTNPVAHSSESSHYSRDTERREVFAYCGYEEEASGSGRTIRFAGDKGAPVELCERCKALYARDQANY